MCMATPSEIVELRENHLALVSFGGVQKEISLALLDDVACGDYVRVHTGFAIAKVDSAMAAQTLQVMAEISAFIVPDIVPSIPSFG